MYQIVSDKPQNGFSKAIADLLREEEKHKKESLLVAIYIPQDGDKSPAVVHNCDNNYELQDALYILQDCVNDLKMQAAIMRELEFYGIIGNDDDEIEEGDDADE